MFLKDTSAGYYDKYFIKQPRLRRFITRLVYGKKIAKVELLGAEFFVDALQENGYLRAAKMGIHSSLYHDEASVLITLSSLVRDNQTFIDIGANVGLYSVVLSRFKKLFPNFDVIAFEVNPDTYARLCLNSELHGFKAYNSGIGDRQEKVKFVKGAVSHVTTRVEFASSYNISNEFFYAEIKPLVIFDDHLKGGLMIKIDVEGQEYYVLNGAKAYFENKRVQCVYMDGYADERCWDFLESYGFTLLDANTLRRASKSTFALLAINRNI